MSRDFLLFSNKCLLLSCLFAGCLVEMASFMFFFDVFFFFYLLVRDL